MGTPATAASSAKVAARTRRRKVWKSVQAAESRLTSGSGSMGALTGSRTARLDGEVPSWTPASPVGQARLQELSRATPAARFGSEDGGVLARLIAARKGLARVVVSSAWRV